MSTKLFITSLFIGVSLRLGLLGYGYWQDATMAVKYTDIDYRVFCDASRFVHQGISPYQRATYRYTPLLSWMLLPNIYIGEIFGKLLFTLFDVATAILIYSITHRHAIKSRKITVFAACFWFINPFAANICTRGNSESIMTFLTLFTLFLFERKRTTMASIFFALSVHFKIYPVTYSLPIYLALNERSHAESSSGNTSLTRNRNTLHQLVEPTRLSFRFISFFVLTILLLTSACYKIYGWPFIHHTYLYHITRRDVRHNFSPYFYLLYLASPSNAALSLMMFVPQLTTLLALSWKYYRDPIFVCFLHTFVFVMFNKVCTSQYFLWYLCYVPLILPHLHMTTSSAVALPSLWLLGQGLWLLPAYLLEFKGHNTFLWIWSAGLVYFIINTYILTQILKSYRKVDNKADVNG